MARSFHPRLDILPTPQQRLWEELIDIPTEFVLYGGTAIALQLGHRVSVDFDFFAAKSFDPYLLMQSLPFLQDSARVLQQSANTLTVMIDRGGPVQVSFFGVPRLGRISEPVIAEGTELRIADLVDLAGTKAAVVQKRAEAKDYLDIDALIQGGVIDLSTALAAGQIIYGMSFNPELTLKSLTFFGDGNLPAVPPEVQARLVAAVKAVDLLHLPSLNSIKSWTVLENGR